MRHNVLRLPFATGGEMALKKILSVEVRSADPVENDG
jgi:hypothetical protein